MKYQSFIQRGFLSQERAGRDQVDQVEKRGHNVLTRTELRVLVQSRAGASGKSQQLFVNAFQSRTSRRTSAVK